MLSHQIGRLRELAASTDGSLLDDTTWNARHRRISQLGWALTAFVLIFTVADSTHESREWIYGPLMAGLMLLAAGDRWGRRVRELAIAGTFVATQIFISRYVGNVTGLGAIYVIVLTFYQDWVPIVFVCSVAILLIVVAAIDPQLFANNRGFEKEQPLPGMSFRALSIVLAASLAFAVWRHGTQLARDQLTGALSRAGAERVLESDIERGRQPAVWVCDIDNFRAVNTELGSAVGDQLLKHVAHELKRVAATVPGGAVCARLQADTFLVASHDNLDDTFVDAFAHGLESEAGAPAHGIALDDVPVRLSVGAAIALPGESAVDLIRTAERAMSTAKGQGNMRVVVERDASRRRTSSTERAASLLVSEIYRGCENGEFDLFFQPIVSLEDGQPVGAEALARWHHPGRGLLDPGVFMPDAERDSALMAALSRTLGARFASLVSSLVDRRGADWLPYGYAYNLAAIRFRDPTLLDGSSSLLALAGRAHAERKVIIEITEGALMGIAGDVPGILREMRAQGYKLALDDFGVGHSSLAHLRDFPLDTVKIDQSFAQSVERSSSDRAVVQAVSDIAAARGLQIVAEGVETEAQRAILVDINPAILGQGWLFSKALPFEDFERWVFERKLVASELAESS